MTRRPSVTSRDENGLVFTVKGAFSPHAEVDCGVPPPIPHSVRLWDNVSTVGSRVVYQCDAGYRGVGEGNVSVCAASGKWDAAPLHCQGENDTRAFSYLQNKSSEAVSLKRLRIRML